MDIGNVNIKEEQQQSYAHNPMFKQHQSMMREQEDLHMALKSCNEIGSAKTLLQFMTDLQKISGSVVPSARSVQRIKNDNAFKQFLQTVIVCTEQDYKQEDLDKVARAEFRLDYGDRYMDLLSDIIKELLKENKLQRLQTFGYSLEQGTSHLILNEDHTMAGGAGIASSNEYVKCNFINLNKQCMITRNWESVYKILGDTVFKHIYKEYIIFLKTRDDSLVQISGTNIFVYLNDKLGRLQQAFYDGKKKQEEPAAAKPAATEAVEGEADPAKPKKKVVGGEGKNKNIKSHKYNLKNEKDDFTNNIGKGFWEDIVNRNRLFYCTHMNRKNAFFQKHILNTKNATPIDVATKIYSQMFGCMKMRKEVKGNVMKMLEQVVVKQKKFDYNYYLTKNCPLPDDWKAKKKEMLEKSTKGKVERGSVYKDLFVADSAYRQVADFLTEFIAQVLPTWFMEGKNKKVFNRKVYQFVKFNRFEMFTKITLLDKFEISNITWLSYKSNSKNSKYFQNENVFILWRVLKWIFEELLISLMRCFFYCTEKQKEYSRIFYYRKAIWSMVMRMSIEDLLKETLKSVQKAEMNSHCENHNFAPGKLRLIPKGDTFRPIMTFNRKIPHTKNMTTNKKLAFAHMMLKNLKSKMFKHNFGFAVFNYDDIMKKFEKFRQKWIKVGKPKLYFVTMDIEKCYDNVDSEKVVNFLQKTDLLEKEYFILNCFVLKRKNNVIMERNSFKKQPIKQHFRYKFQKIGIDGGTYPTLYDILEEENDLNFKRTIIAEQEQRKKLQKNDLLQPLQYIAKNNYITFNKKQFKQTKGIPQGLCVSYILSSFYYANLEDQLLQFLRKEQISPEALKKVAEQEPGGMEYHPNYEGGGNATDLGVELNCLMRLTDDYLLMTTNKNNAMLFVERMQDLANKSSFKFNQKKLKTNFYLNLQKIGCHATHDLDSQNIETEFCHWIGISIDMKSLQLIPNINVKKEGVLCTLNVNMQTSQSIMWLKKKLKSFLMNNVSFYFRRTLNGESFAYTTLNKLYQAGAEKYIACCMEFKQFHMRTTLESTVDLKICQIIYVVIRSFFKYLVCNVKNPVFDRKDYHKFFKFSLSFFSLRFGAYKNQFKNIYSILKAKMERLDTEQAKFNIH